MKGERYDTEWTVANLQSTKIQMLSHLIDSDTNETQREKSQRIPLYRWSLKLNRCFTLSDLSSSRVKSTANKHNCSSQQQIDRKTSVTKKNAIDIPMNHPVTFSPWTSYVLFLSANSVWFATSVVWSNMTSWKQMRCPSFDASISVSMKSVPSSIALCKNRVHLSEGLH